MTHPRVCCLDIETTGLHFLNGDRIVEIAAVEVLDGSRLGAEFHSFVNPQGRKSHQDAYRVHKIRDEFLLDKPTFEEVAPAFLDFLGNSPPVAHNGKKFDGPFLNYELEKANLELLPSPLIDTYVMAERMPQFRGGKSLDALLDHYRIDRSARVNHGALIDTRLLAELYVHLLGRHMLLDEADMAQAAEEAAAEAIESGIRLGHEWFPKRELLAARSDEESRHHDFIKKMKDPIWSRWI